MDMFNKLKNAVSSALPGNPLSKDFEVYGQIGTAGPGLLWKVYNGMKRTTKQDAAVFLFDKKSIEKYSRRDKELIVDALRRGAAQLTRLRHPKILSVMQPLEESRETLAFATEPVFASLANVLGRLDNIPESVAKELKEHKLYDVEIKYGLLQVTEALKFLHQDVKLLHNNVCPESIIINKNGAWKLAGFDFCVQNKTPQDQVPLFPYKDWDPDIPPCAQPNLDYMAPEYAISESCSLACDMFSIGMLIYAMFNSGKPMYECNNQLNTFRKNAEELRKWRGSLLGIIPKELQDIVKLLFNTEPSVRPDPDQLVQISFFEDVGSKTLQYMDMLFQQDNLPKSKFFKGLPKIIVKLPKRVNLQRILPPLFKECVNPDMIPFVLPNILQIAEQATDKEYSTLILPELVPMFKITSPVQILLIFMQNMNLLLRKTPASDIKTHVLPMINKALESDNSQIQELCLTIIPTFADTIDYSAIKTSIVPRIKKMCLATSVTGVRVNCLICLGKMLESMDKWYVLDEVLPLLPQIPSRESAVLMSILGIYKVALTHEKLGITKDLLAGSVVPFLTTLCIEHSLNLGQFTAFITLIREMVDKIETEHRSKLEQLEQMKQEQKNMEITKITEEDENTLISGIDEKPKTMMDNFLSGYITSNSSGKASSASQGKSVSPASSQPAKVTLSLEEKQRIAKQQEQKRYRQAAKPLETKSLEALPASNHTGISNGSLGLNMHNNSSGSSMGNRTTLSSMGSANYRPSVPMMNQSGLTSTSGQTFSQNTFGLNSSSNTADPLSFDNLLSSTTKKHQLPMEGIGQRPNVGSVPKGMMGNMNNQSMMGKQNLMGQQGMMGNMIGQQGMMGNQTLSGQQGMMGNQTLSGQQGMMGNQTLSGHQGMMGNQSLSGQQGMMGNQSLSGQQGMMGRQGMMGNQNLSGQQAMMAPNLVGQGNMNSGFWGSSSSTTGGLNFQQKSTTSEGNLFQNQQTGGRNIMQPQILNDQSTRSTLAKNDLDDLLG